MQGIAHGSIKSKGLSKDQAAEYVAGQSPKGLPERVEEKKEHAKPKKNSAKVWPKRGFLGDE